MICSNQIDEYYGHYYSIRLFLGPRERKTTIYNTKYVFLMYVSV